MPLFAVLIKASMTSMSSCCIFFRMPLNWIRQMRVKKKCGNNPKEIMPRLPAQRTIALMFKTPSHSAGSLSGKIKYMSPAIRQALPNPIIRLTNREAMASEKGVLYFKDVFNNK